VPGEQDDNEDAREAAHEPRECMACRGSGQVISNLGGAPSDVACPWCEGSGTRQPGIDAQARWVAERERESAAEGAPPPTD
jgi:DnaJ-class molecular chaperone